MRDTPVLAEIPGVISVFDVLHVIVVTRIRRRVVDDVSQGIPFSRIVIVCDDLIYGHGACSR